MVPSRIELLDELPLTPSRKIDRQALMRRPLGGRARVGGGYQAPRDSLELELVRIFEEVLQTRPLGVRDGFFQRGGQSLMAVQLMARIEKDSGRRLPLSALFENDTVEHLAQLLRQQGPVEPSALVALQPGGSLRPLFLVHPAGGSVFGYLPLAHRMGQQRPLYGLQATRLERGGQDSGSIEQMASDYLKEVRALQPDGPYLLGGHSMGGLVAFDMARQLMEAGEPVGRLVLIDAPPPQTAARAPFSSQALLRSFGLHLGISTELLAEEEAAPAELLAHARQRSLIPPDLSASRLQQLFELFRSHAQAALAYRAQPLAVQPLLMRASQTDLKAVLRWQRFLPLGLEVLSLPGSHFTLLKPPQVEALASQLRKALE